jgi:hypothetical protein
VSDRGTKKSIKKFVMLVSDYLQTFW